MYLKELAINQMLYGIDQMLYGKYDSEYYEKSIYYCKKVAVDIDKPD